MSAVKSQKLKVGMATYVLLAGLWWLLPTTGEAATIGKPSNLLTLNSGLVGWWTFDGPDVSDTTVIDRSGNGNVGTIISGSKLGAGKMGQAMSLDGSNGGVRVGHIGDSLVAMTISGWMRARTSDAGAMNIANENGSASLMRYSDERFRFTTSGLAPNNVVASDGVYADTEWHHVVGVYDGASIDIYVDGEDDRSATVSASGTMGSNLVDNNGQMHLGIQYGLSPLDGTIDDVRVYNRALTAAEVKALYNIGQGKRSTSPATDSNDPLQQGLVGWWTFDGPDMYPNVRDKSGQGNHGRLVNFGATTTVPGKLGQALKTDGVNDFATVSDNNSLDFANGAEITIALWLNSTNANTALVDILNKYTNYYVEIPIGAANSNRNIHFGYNDGTWRTFVTSGTPIKPNTWHHAVFTYTFGVGATARAYIDGVQVSASWTAGGDGAPMNNSSPINIGSWDGSTENFQGKLDDVRIYSRTLSASEIRHLYESTTGDKMSATPAQPAAASGCTSGLSCGLVGHWTFDGPDVNWVTGAITDRSGNGNTGYVVNMSTTTSVTRGKMGQAFKFDASNDYVNTGSDTVLDNIDTKTICAWFKALSYGEGNAYGTIIGKFGTSGGNIGWALGTLDSGGGVPALNYYQETSTGIVGNWHVPISLNVWTHECMSYDRTPVTNAPAFYVNGVPVAPTQTGTPTGSADDESVYNITIGSINVLGEEVFDGFLDDVRIYNRALSASEIRQLYEIGR